MLELSSINTILVSLQLSIGGDPVSTWVAKQRRAYRGSVTS